MNYSRQIALAQSMIRRYGQLVTYQPIAPKQVPTNSDTPWKVEPDPGVIEGLSNLVNSSLGGSDPVGFTDPNLPPASKDVYMLFLDAKARGSNTQGMVSEFISRLDIPAGNKLGLLAGGQGLSPVLGDTVDRNRANITGYPIYKLIKYKTLDPGGVIILYALEFEL